MFENQDFPNPIWH